MKKIVFTFPLTILCFIVNAQFNSLKDPFLTKSFPNELVKKIDAETSHGSILVSSVPAADTRIEVYIHLNRENGGNLSKEELQKLLDENYTLEVSVSGGTLNAVAKQNKTFNDWKKSLSISFTIYTPREVSSVLKTSHGNISITSLTGDEDISTSHGNLDIQKINGKLTGQTSHGNISVIDASTEIELSTSHGNIDTKNCDGIVKLSTSNGNIQLNTIKGKIRANTSHGVINGDVVTGELSAVTSHGSIDLRNLSCSVRASNDHGGISLYFNELTGPVTVDNSHGNISLQLPKGKGIGLDLQAKSIQIDNMQNFSGSKGEHAIKGNLDGGGVNVKATTDKGAIILSFK